MKFIYDNTSNATTFSYEGNSLVHHGIKGQKWGVRRFQNADGSLTLAGKKRYRFGIGGTDRQLSRDASRIRALNASSRQPKVNVGVGAAYPSTDFNADFPIGKENDNQKIAKARKKKMLDLAKQASDIIKKGHKQYLASRKQKSESGNAAAVEKLDRLWTQFRKDIRESIKNANKAADYYDVMIKTGTPFEDKHSESVVLDSAEEIATRVLRLKEYQSFDNYQSIRGIKR